MNRGDTLAVNQSQRFKILGLLISALGGWVSLRAIKSCAVQYNARIFELRRIGFRIDNKVSDMDGVRHSHFRLEFAPAVLNWPQTKTIASTAGGGK